MEKGHTTFRRSDLPFTHVSSKTHIMASDVRFAKRLSFVEGGRTLTRNKQNGTDLDVQVAIMAAASYRIRSF